MTYTTNNMSFRRQVFPANHSAMVLTKQTYNNQDKYKKPKDVHKKPRKLLLIDFDLPTNSHSSLQRLIKLKIR